MKPMLSLLICLLLAHDLRADVAIKVTVRGTLTCSERFYYRIKLWEQDHHATHDFVATSSTTPSVNPTVKYEISGTAEDGFLEWEVEPLMTIEHSCKTATPKCICKDLGSHGAGFTADVDVNLETTDLKSCILCYYAKSGRTDK